MRKLGFFVLLAFAGLLLNGSAAPGRAQLIINPTFDSSITNDVNAMAIENTINAAIAVYKADFSTSITVNITFHEQTTGLGNSSTYGSSITYTQFRAALVSHATTSNDAIALGHLPSGANNPVNGSSTIRLTTANLRALGFNVNPPMGLPDCNIYLNVSSCNITRTNPASNKYDLMAVASHEMDEALGLGSALNGLNNGDAAPTGDIDVMDLFRYDQNGNRSFTTDVNAQAYFSLDNGITTLARYNQHQGGDFQDWYSYYGGQTPQVQDAYGTPGSAPNLGVELTALDAIGYSLNNVATDVLFVDGSFNGSPQNGTYTNPFKTVTAANNAASASRTTYIYIKGNSYLENLTFGKPLVLLDNGGGTARIGGN